VVEAFISREEPDDSGSFEQIRNDLEESNSKLQRDIMDAHAASEARAYKIRAQSALNAAMHRESKWDETYNRLIENQERLEAIQKGALEPREMPGEFVVEWAAYSASIQMFSLALLGLFIAVGAWPISLITIPSLLAYNWIWLKRQKEKDG